MLFPQIHNTSVRNSTASHLTLITKSNLTLCTVQYEMQLQVDARWSLLRWSWVFIINMLISGNVCSKDFYFYFANTWQERSRQRKKSRVKYSFYWTTVFFFFMCECLSSLFNKRQVCLSSSSQRLNVSSGQKQSSVHISLLLITSSNDSDEDFIQQRAYGFWQLCDGGVIRARGPRKQLLWKRESVYWIVFCTDGLSLKKSLG